MIDKIQISPQNAPLQRKDAFADFNNSTTLVPKKDLITSSQDKYINNSYNETKFSKKNITITALIATSLIGVGALLKLQKQKGFKKLSKNDAEYLEKLAQGLMDYLHTTKKISPNKLTSIVGSDELKNIMLNLKPENYSIRGKNFENVLNGTYQANLHVHTDFSDGTMTVSELLEQSAKYANKLYSKTGKNFILALTDHETLEGTKEAIKLIAQNPQKYKHLKFVAGMEKGFATPSPQSPFGNPTEMSEIIAYSINPFCPKLNKFIDELQENRKSVAKIIINEANEKIPSAQFSLEGSNLLGTSHPKSLMMDGQWAVAQYLRKIKPNEEAKINELCRKYRPNWNGNSITFPTEYATESTLKEIIDITKLSGDGFLGLAHPAFLTTKGFNSPADIIKSFKQQGQDIAYAAEMYYQDYNNLSKNEIEKINDFCHLQNLTPTAGLDNHSNNIFNAHKSDNMSEADLQKLFSY